MEELREQIRALGPAPLSVHLHGETGTGKELVARALHATSGRRGRFVALNAAGLTDGLLESELFGHARGAFTGAVGDREGLVAAAEGGTLFLDEVAELSARGQAMLLRVLEDGEYYRLGESVARRAQVRVVSAANEDLALLVEERRFRKDLRFRLEGERITVPPLRDRGRDVLHLARHFLAWASGPGQRPPVLSREAEQALSRYSWPGNVRELLREAQRVVVRASDGVVHRRHLSPELRRDAPGWRGSFRAARDEWERHHIIRALERHGGNRTATAAEMGISRQALVAKIRRHGIGTSAPARGGAGRQTGGPRG
jgi:DNA-binding NtrC family response regulator